MLKNQRNILSAYILFCWAILPVWLLVTTGGDSIGQVEQRGLSIMGRGGIDFPPRFLSEFCC